MKQYDSYKDSGIEWIGKIPSHWGVYRIRYNYYLKGRIGWQGLKADEFIDEGPYLITGTDFIKGKVNWDTCYHISKERYDEAPEIHVKEGDLLITKDGTVGKTAYIDRIQGPSSLNSHLLIIRPFNGRCNNLFLQYVINSKVFDSFMWIFQTGSIMASISQEKFSDFRFPLPSKEEQLHIISYLDKKCEEIDKAIATQQSRIDLLGELCQNIITNAVTRGINPDAPLKDSGVEWIGKVPEHWEVRNLKTLLKVPLQYGANEPAEDMNEDYPRYIRITDITDSGNLKKETWKSLNPSKAQDYLLMKGDVLFARSGATVGKTYMFNENYPACYAGYLIKATCNHQLSPLYLLYYTQSGLYDNWKNSIFVQSTIQNIGADKYSYLPIIVPPISEQHEIVSYIESKTASLDNAIEKANRQIELLQELKQSIITEVVTGKRKVVA